MAAESKKTFVPAKDFLARFSADEQAAIQVRARALIAEELTLRDLRKALALTQTQLSTTLGVGQEQVSRMEQRTDLLLSTLASYVDAMGGKLRGPTSYTGSSSNHSLACMQVRSWWTPISRRRVPRLPAAHRCWLQRS